MMKQIKDILKNKYAIGLIIVLVKMGTILPFLTDNLMLGAVAAVALIANAKFKVPEITKTHNITEAAGNVVAFGILFSAVTLLQSMQIDQIANMAGLMANLKLGVAATAIAEVYDMVVGKVIKR